MDFGYVEHDAGATTDLVKNGSFEIQVAGERFTISVSLCSMYDSKNLRVRM